MKMIPELYIAFEHNGLYFVASRHEGYTAVGKLYLRAGKQAKEEPSLRELNFSERIKFYTFLILVDFSNMVHKVFSNGSALFLLLFNHNDIVFREICKCLIYGKHGIFQFFI